MSEKSIFQDSEYLRDSQYKDSSNLDARITLHRRFSTNPIGWPQWVFDHLALESGSRVLECGCGPGWLWRHNLERVPAGCAITLTDFSEGMVAEAAEALAGGGHDFQFRPADIQELPFDDASFDVVIANHMLYHVPDRDRGLAEVRRVLKRNGRFYAATNGKDHMRQFWDMAEQLFPKMKELLRERRRAVAEAFGLENGRSQLEPWFADVRLHLYKDGLAVTEAAPLLAYLRSTTTASGQIAPEREQAIAEYAEQEIAEKGALYITKSSCLFTARRAISSCPEITSLFGD